MEILQPLASIALVFALMGGSFWLLRRSRMMSFRAIVTGRKSPAMERVGRLQLTPQHALHMVRFDGRLLLVGTHAAGLTVVEERPEALAESGKPSC
jgi:flagellar biogenesis protein FliO